MYKKGRRRSMLPEIQEESLSDPLLHQILNAQSGLDSKRAAGSSSGFHSQDSVLTSNIEKAAALVDQAMKGRWMPLDVVHHKDYLRAKQAFLLYHHLSYPRCVVLVILVMLSFFEVPEWCHGESANPCGDSEKFLLSGIPYLHPYATLAIEGFCLVLLAWSVALQRYFKFLSFWNKRLTIVKVVLLVSLAVSMFLTILPASWISVFQGRKVSMYLRVLITIIFSRALRGCFRMTLRILYAFLDAAVLLLVFVLLSSWLASLVLQDTEFKNYPTAFLNLFVLLTSSDNSRIWASTYRHRIAILFLLIYTVIGILFLMNVAFAVIYTNFKAQMEAESKKQLTARQGSLRAAFSLLDNRHQEWIDGPTMIALFLAIGKYRHIPDVRSQSSQLFLALNKRGDFKIWSDDFEDLCDVIAKEVQKHPKPTSFSRYRQSEIMWVVGQFQCVKGILYDYFLWVATLTSVAVALYRRNVTDSAILKIFGNLELIFGCFFMIDCILKILILGFDVFRKSILNCFDGFSAAAIMGLLLASYIYPVTGNWVPIFLVLRSFRVVALLSYVPRWHLLYQTLLRLVPTTASIIGLQFCVCSLFSLLGVHLFEGLVYIGNPKVEGTEYASSGLWMFNYNDYASAHATSFSFFTISSWYIIMEGYAATTGSNWSRLYFISFWAIAMAFTLNAMIVFFVETYTLQLEKAKAKAKASAEQKRKEAVTNFSTVARMRTVPGHFMMLKKTASYHNFPSRR